MSGGEGRRVKQQAKEKKKETSTRSVRSSGESDKTEEHGINRKKGEPALG